MRRVKSAWLGVAFAIALSVFAALLIYDLASERITKTDEENFQRAIAAVNAMPSDGKTAEAVGEIMNGISEDLVVWKKSDHRGVSFAYYRWPMGPFQGYDVESGEIFYEE